MHNRVIWILLAALYATGVSIPSREHLGNGMRRRRRVSLEAPPVGEHLVNRDARRDRSASYGTSKHQELADDIVAELYEDAPSAYMNTRYLQDKIEPVMHTDDLYIDYEKTEIPNPPSTQTAEEEGLHEALPDDSHVDNTNFNIVGLSTESFEVEDSTEDFLDTDSDDTDYTDFDITGQSTESEQMTLVNDGSEDNDDDSEEDPEYDTSSDDDEDDGDILVQGQAMLLDDESEQHSNTIKHNTWTEDELYEPLEEDSFDGNNHPNTDTHTFRAIETPDDIDVSDGLETGTRDFSEEDDLSDIPHDMGETALHYIQEGHETDNYDSLGTETVSDTDIDDASYETGIEEEYTHVNGQSIVRGGPSTSDESPEALELGTYTDDDDYLHIENRNYVHPDEDGDDDDDDLELAHDDREAYPLEDDEHMVGDVETESFEDNEHDEDFKGEDSIVGDSSFVSEGEPTSSTKRSVNEVHTIDSIDHEHSEGLDDDDDDVSEWAEELDESAYEHDGLTRDVRTASSKERYSSDREYDSIDDGLSTDPSSVDVSGYAIVSDGAPNTRTSSSSDIIHQDSEGISTAEHNYSEHDQDHAELDDDNQIFPSAHDTSNISHDADDEYIFDEEDEWHEHDDLHVSGEQFSPDSLHLHTDHNRPTIQGYSKLSHDLSEDGEALYADVSEHYDSEEEFASDSDANSPNIFMDASNFVNV